MPQNKGRLTLSRVNLSRPRFQQSLGRLVVVVTLLATLASCQNTPPKNKVAVTDADVRHVIIGKWYPYWSADYIEFRPDGWCFSYCTNLNGTNYHAGFEGLWHVHNRRLIFHWHRLSSNDSGFTMFDGPVHYLDSSHLEVESPGGGGEFVYTRYPNQSPVLRNQLQFVPSPSGQ